MAVRDRCWVAFTTGFLVALLLTAVAIRTGRAPSTIQADDPQGAP